MNIINLANFCQYLIFLLKKKSYCVIKSESTCNEIILLNQFELLFHINKKMQKDRHKNTFTRRMIDIISDKICIRKLRRTY